MKVRDLIEHLKTYNPEEEIAYDLWIDEDVLCQAEQMDDGIPLTEQDCRDILIELEHNLDSTVGINWDVLADAIKNHIKGK